MADNKGGFLERWALFNIALLLAYWLLIYKLYKSGDPIMHGKQLRHYLVLVPTLVLWPLNAIFAFGSLYMDVMNKWHEHRIFWLLMIAAGVAWVNTFQWLLMSYPRI